LTLSWIRSMHLNFQKVCNFLLQFRQSLKNALFTLFTAKGKRQPLLQLTPRERQI
jgi:hypothetical protein